MEGTTFLTFLDTRPNSYEYYKALEAEFANVPYLKARWDSFWTSPAEEADPECFAGRAAIALAYRTGGLTTMIYKAWLKSFNEDKRHDVMAGMITCCDRALNDVSVDSLVAITECQELCDDLNAQVCGLGRSETPVPLMVRMFVESAYKHFPYKEVQNVDNCNKLGYYSAMFDISYEHPWLSCSGQGNAENEAAFDAGLFEARGDRLGALQVTKTGNFIQISNKEYAIQLRVLEKNEEDSVLFIHMNAGHPYFRSKEFRIKTESGHTLEEGDNAGEYPVKTADLGGTFELTLNYTNQKVEFTL